MNRFVHLKGMMSIAAVLGLLAAFAGAVTAQETVPLYATGNVLAVGVWNGDTGSSDLAVTAELADNNGVIYVQDTSAAGGWPAGTIFRYKEVYYKDGFGEEEPGWQQRGFDDSAAKGWVEQTDAGFTLGYGGNDAENGETPIDSSVMTVYTRSIFDVQNIDTIYELTLKLVADEEAVAWLNGVFIGPSADGTTDRGETAENYVFDTLATNGEGGLENGINPSTYTGSGARIYTIKIKDKPYTVARDIPTNGFIAGQTVTGIKLTVNNPEGSNRTITVTETPPAGWTVSNTVPSAGTATMEGGNIVWKLTNTGGSTLTYAVTPPADAIKGAWSATSTDGTYKVAIDGPDTLYPMPPFYKQGNVLAVGVWNDGTGSSDLAVTAELSDNNGVIYVQDSSAAGGWPAGTIFRWKVVLYDDGTGEEEPGWQGRDFKNDTEANGWIEQKDAGFTIGHGGNDAENGETLLDSTNETVYTRSIFDAQNYETITQLTLKLAGDDEAVAWLNGTFLGFSANGLSDRGETAENYVFDTTINTYYDGLEDGSNPSGYSDGSGRKTLTLFVNKVEAPVVPVSDWPVY
ncbi:MAG: hypothetical protein ACE15F_05315 [bacterium]